MLKVDEIIKREKDVVAGYIHVSSEQKLLKVVQCELLSTYATRLLNDEDSGYVALLREDKVDDLSRMFELFSMIPHGLDDMPNMFMEHVTSEGRTLVKDIRSPKILFQKLSELHIKYQGYVARCFKSHMLFQLAFKEAFGILCNDRVSGNACAKLFASICDEILKNGQNEDDTTWDKLNEVLMLLPHIHDKDVFAEIYRNNLFSRLLFHDGATNKHEWSIVTKLTQQYGRAFTSEMTNMLSDMVLAKESQLQFRQYLKDKPDVNLSVDFSPTVLTRHFWPSHTSSNLEIPTELVECLDIFRKFYHETYANRSPLSKPAKLECNYAWSKCHVIGRFDSQSVELIVTTPQACALQLFNESNGLTYEEIKNKLNLEDNEVTSVLSSLCSEKYSLLIKKPKHGTISHTDYFEFNSKFSHEKSTIEIPLHPMNPINQKVVVDNRKYAIQALVVRIMKENKCLDYQKLVSECIKAPKMFELDEVLIKQNVENLIEREYLTRDIDQNLVYIP